jgi:hypothetical protein
MGHVFRTIKREVHGGGLDCNFLDMDLVSEYKDGLHTTWTFKCRMCNKVTKINSDDPERKKSYMQINDAAVNGSLAIGIGYSQFSELTSSMDIHCMSAQKYGKHHTTITGAIHDAAWMAMFRAAQQEIEIAMLEGNVDEDGTPLCTVIADGQWCKRSYKTKYDSYSGVVSASGSS